MIKDVYLFTNGMIVAFDDGGQQRADCSGRLTDELKARLVEEFGDGTRITFARWKKGFFDLTRAEFLVAEIEEELLVLRFATDKPVEDNEANSPS